MKNNSLLQFIKLRRQLTDERATLQERLGQINEALGEMPLPSLAPIQNRTETQPIRRRGRWAKSAGPSLREHVLAVLASGSKTKEEVLAAVKKRGYQFSTNNPMNSLGVVLYGKNPAFKRVDGKFSIGGGVARSSAPSAKTAGKSAAPRRRMSAAARKAIAEAARRRWAAAKASGRNAL